MPHDLKKLTPNLIVADVGRSLAFYRDVLGFQATMTVPEQAPFIFAAVQSGPVEIFLNAPEPAMTEYPAFRDQAIGGTLTLFVEVTGIARVYEDLRERITVVMPFEQKWYGMTEFAFTDPDGYIITYAERS